MSVIEICTLDIQQASIFWSIRVYHQIGFDIRKQEFLGKSSSIFYNSECKHMVCCLFKKVDTNKQPRQWEW